MGVRHLSLKALNSLFASGDKVFRFRFVVIDRANDPLDIGELRLREGLEGWIRCKELRCDLVDLFVGALRGEHDRDKKLVLVLKVQLGVWIRIELREGFEEELFLLRGHEGGFYSGGRMPASGAGELTAPVQT